MAGIGIFVVFLIFALRRSNRSVSLPRPVWAIVWLYLRLIVLGVVLAAFGVRGAALPVVGLVLFFAPPLAIDRIIVPLGWPRAAYWAARCCWPLESARESRAGAALCGALALTRRQASRPAIDWLDGKLKLVSAPRGTSVVAAGLLAALRGDRNRARCLFLTADTLGRRHISRRARVVARDWLVVDAARIGNWREVIRLGRRGWGSLRWSYAIARIGERLLGDPRGCRDGLLWLCWLAAPRRLATLPLLRRALAIPPAPESTATPPAAAENLPRTLAGLTDAIRNRFAQDAPSLARTISAIAAQLDGPAARARVERRLLALGGNDAAAVLARVRTLLADMVEPVIEERPSLADAGDQGPILAEAVERVRARSFRDVEAQCRDYVDRQNGKSALSAIAEWEIWAATRNTADRLLELAPGSEHALFQIMYAPACNFAVFQQNVHRRTTLAHDIYRWLHGHCHTDESGSQLLMRNMKSSRG